MRKIAVIGSGSWGIALSNHLAECGNKVSLWSFTEEEKNAINNEHRCIFIPGSKINEIVTSFSQFIHNYIVYYNCYNL